MSRSVEGVAGPLPKRSTPSLAADMMAFPKVVGSNRVGRLDVLRLAAWERVPMPVGAAVLPVPTIRGPMTGEDCCRS